MSKYKVVDREGELESIIDTTDIEALRDEMQEWVSNMSGTGLENTNKYSMAEEASNTLDNVDNIEIDNLWNVIPEEEREAIKHSMVKYTEFVPKARRQSTSRATRLSNEVGRIRAGLEWLEKEVVPKYKELQEAIDEIESQVTDLESVEFPTMFS